MSLKTEIKHRAALWARDCSYRTASLLGFLSFRLVIAILIFYPAATICGKTIKNNSAINTAKNISAAAVADVQAVPLWGGAALAANYVRPQETTIVLHHFDQPCTNCHESNYNSNEQGLVISDINRACSSSCHNYEQSLNHPVGVTMANTISSDMPLDRNSRITCLTCHSQPAKSTNSYSSDLKQGPFLRTRKNSQLCASCHEKIPGNMKQQAHWQFSGMAHLADINPASDGSTVDNFSISNGNVDEESNACLGCHNDKTVTIVPFNETVAQKRARWERMTDHPIGMEYRQVATQKRTKYPYHYPIANANIRLFDGKVGCGSCHSLYATDKNNLVRGDDHNALCRDCHAN